MWGDRTAGLRWFCAALLVACSILKGLYLVHKVQGSKPEGRGDCSGWCARWWEPEWHFTNMDRKEIKLAVKSDVVEESNMTSTQNWGGNATEKCYELNDRGLCWCSHQERKQSSEIWWITNLLITGIWSPQLRWPTAHKCLISSHRVSGSPS